MQLFSPNMTGESSPSPFVATQSAEFSAAYAGWKPWSLNNGSGNHWLISGFSGFVAIDLGSPFSITGYVIGGNPFGDTTNPKTWTFEGSTDGTGWTVLDTRTNYTSFNLLSFSSFVIAGGANYRHYKLNITANNGSASFVGCGPIMFQTDVVTPSPAGFTGLSGVGRLGT
jgi:hypothetical protein